MTRSLYLHLNHQTYQENGVLVSSLQCCPLNFNYISCPFLFPQMIFFLVSCIILVIVVGVQTAIAALGYIFWRLFRVATDCKTYGGTCHCRNSEGKSIPLDRKCIHNLIKLKKIPLRWRITLAFARGNFSAGLLRNMWRILQKY